MYASCLILAIPNCHTFHVRLAAPKVFQHLVWLTIRAFKVTALTFATSCCTVYGIESPL
jgi:hypothetical protein